ncbi:hypothetical protein PGIGA_G00239390 [Pangasianodon gigas]|uniref:Uncharacterized protein n=1 Tax=Pangasianodon gigas TaxID=30993 RepID=A0ACC5WMR4_PANGG|nr:hypothetical protein [Pangasianodon gigas]
MKMSCVFFFLGFVIIMALSSDARPQSLDFGQCCFKFFHGKIPPQQVLKVENTDSHCPQQGFIVTTPKFPNLCVREDPRERN